MARDYGESVRKRVGKNVRKFRRMRDLSIGSLSGQIPHEPHYLAMVERGEANVSIGILSEIAEHLSIDVDELFRRPRRAKGQRIYTITQSEVDKIDELIQALILVAKRVKRANS